MSLDEFERTLDRLLEYVESGRAPGREELEGLARQGGIGSAADLEETLGMIRRLRLGESLRIPADLDRRILESVVGDRGASGLRPLGKTELKQILVKCFRDETFRTAFLASPEIAATEFSVALTEDQHQELSKLLRMDWSIASEEQLEARVSSILLRFFG